MSIVLILCSRMDCFSIRFASYTSLADFNLMQSHRLLPLTMTSSRTRFIVSILCSHTGCDHFHGIYPLGHSHFNLMQSTRTTSQRRCFALASRSVSILCSRVGYVGNSAQRLHFLHNVVLCILLSFGAVMVVCC